MSTAIVTLQHPFIGLSLNPYDKVWDLKSWDLKSWDLNPGLPEPIAYTRSSGTPSVHGAQIQEEHDLGQSLSSRLLRFTVQTATVLFMSSSVPLCSTQFLIWARDLGARLPDNRNDAVNRGGAANRELRGLGRIGGASPECGAGRGGRRPGAPSQNLPSGPYVWLAPRAPNEPEESNVQSWGGPPGAGSPGKLGGW